MYTYNLPVYKPFEAHVGSLPRLPSTNVTLRDSFAWTTPSTDYAQYPAYQHTK